MLSRLGLPVVRVDLHRYVYFCQALSPILPLGIYLGSVDSRQIPKHCINFGRRHCIDSRQRGIAWADEVIMPKVIHRESNKVGNFNLWDAKRGIKYRLKRTYHKGWALKEYLETQR